MMTHSMQAIVIAYSDFFLWLANVIGNYGITTILLSFLVTILMIYPLKWANKIAKKEQEFQSVITPKITKIKQESQGAEQHYRISALYSRYSYHPIYSLRLVTGLFIQLPFLILTFFMFDGLDETNGQSFLFLSDLGTSDGLLFGGGNLLPFIMIIVNLIAATFTPYFTRKDMMQAVFVSLLFFILLYNAKAILLLFWTTNNLFLLLRNALAYQQTDSKHRFNFRAYWRKINCFLLRKEVFYFFVVFTSYAFIFKIIFIKNYNLYLSNNLFKLTILILTGLIGYHALLYCRGYWRKINRINNKKALMPPDINLSDCLLIFIPLTPIVQYALLNQQLLTSYEQLQFIAILAIILFTLIWLLPFLLEKFLPVCGLIPLGLALTVIFVSMPTFVAMSSWIIRPDLTLLAGGLLILFSLFHLLYMKQKKLLQVLAVIFCTISSSYTGYLVYFSVSTAANNPYLDRATNIDYSKFIPTTAMQKKPDVYLLTYDAYVEQSTMQQYGINNLAQEDFLLKNGFKIYPNMYSIAAHSDSTMSRMLEMNNKLIKSPYSSLAGNALVPAIFKQQGYKTYGVLYPSFLMDNIGYDFAFPKIGKNYSLGLTSLLEGLKEGEFRFTLINQPREYQQSEWIEAKRKIFAEQTVHPKFMYTHTGPGHSQNSGVCLPNETKLFEQRLIKANQEMQQDLETILASNRSAIIIINGDHGPYLTGDCLHLDNLTSTAEVNQLHLQDRVGAFLAIRWPDDSYQKYDDIRILQDTFEAVFKYLFDTQEVLHQRIPTATIALGGILPEHMVKEGKIMRGVDKGKMLFSEQTALKTKLKKTDYN